MKILNPVAAPRDTEGGSAPAVPDLRGRTVGILTNHWKSMDRMAERMALRLRERYHAAAVRFYDIPINGAMSETVRGNALKECEAAIVGLAN
jgi:hypothetical protein